MIAIFLRDLQQPEYIHVLINPLPVYGVAGGLIGLFIAICQRGRRAIAAALVVVLVSAAAAWPVYEYGERSYDRVLTMDAMLLGPISLGTGCYIAYAGGRIRHREFRTESPPKQLPNQTAVPAPVASPGGAVRAAAQVTMQTLGYS